MATISNAGQDTYKSDLEAAFEALQEQRGTLLDMTRGVQLSSRVLALQEARRIAAKVGADDPRVAAYAASSDAMLRRVAALEVETQIARIRVPVVTRAETLLQGRVTAPDARALAGVEVTLIDVTGAPVANIKPARTDDSGYYAFVLEPAQLDAIGATRQFTLQVGADAGKLVPAGVKAFSLAPGQVIVSEARLQTSEMDQLKLRPVFAATPRPVSVAISADGQARGGAPRGAQPQAEAPAQPAPAPAAPRSKRAAGTKPAATVRAKAAPRKKS
jgi:hypothetical protein